MSDQAALKIDEPRDPKPTVQRTNYPSATRGKRILAFVVDTAICILFARISIFIISHLFVSATTPVRLRVVFLTIGFAWLYYWIAFPVNFKGTVGKRVMKIRIVTFSNSRRITYTQMVLREVVGRFVSAVPLLAGYIWGLFAKDGRTWHDRISDTRVVDYK